ncbi:unnamed protein product [Cuscuta campestris]|uniref:CRAL-TRIO domain-containing protein n=2 Tax=Cuscuta sect. Cleistogrammica TaxID=1824901 RepID=A0A484N796_9ASTE|nr:hypothetical protein DM860_017657 [Cuscuta australis]VFQ96749.1 unnamed protein product [Cuscuta campestris]
MEMEGRNDNNKENKGQKVEETESSGAESFSVEEKHKIELMRALLLKRDPSFQVEVVDDYQMRRFLGARDLDVEKATKMVIKERQWRSAFVPKGHISVSEVPNEIGQNKMFMQGVDKQGRPIAVVFGGRHLQNKAPDEFKRYVVLGLDKLCARTSPGKEKFVVIGDLQGFGYSNSDVRGYIGALSILQDFYPERLGKVFVVHAPYVFWTLYKAVHPFIDDKTKKKIIFVENKRLKSTLLEDIDEDQLPDIYGGKQSLVPIHNA